MPKKPHTIQHTHAAVGSYSDNSMQKCTPSLKARIIQKQKGSYDGAGSSMLTEVAFTFRMKNSCYDIGGKAVQARFSGVKQWRATTLMINVDRFHE